MSVEKKTVGFVDYGGRFFLTVQRNTGEPDICMDSQIAISVNNISKSFYDLKKGPINALSNISFECRTGEITGILGPNGAGKTTLLRIIASLISPSEGEVIFPGSGSSGIRRRIGFLSGDTQLYERLTAREMIEFSAGLYGLAKKDIADKIDELAELFDMKHILRRLCRNLSTGEKQKVSIVRAMVHSPDILILDEPTNGLDLVTSRDILWLVKEMKKQNKTILYSAHNMEEIEKLCDRIIMIYKGMLIEQGFISDVIKRNKTEDLADAFFKLMKKNEFE